MEKLSLRNTEVSDTGLAHLKGLTALKWLIVDGAHVSGTGSAELRETLPNCFIYPLRN